MGKWDKPLRSVLKYGVLALVLALWVPPAGGRDDFSDNGSNPSDVPLTPGPDAPEGGTAATGSAGADLSVPISPTAKSRFKIKPLLLKAGMKQPLMGTAATAVTGDSGASLSAADLYRRELNTLGELPWNPQWEVRELKVGECREFTVTVTRPPAEAGSTRGNMLTWISANLAGDGFDVQPLTRAEMLFDPGAAATWRWRVIGKEAGARRLALTAAYRIDIIAVYEGGAAEDPRYYDVVVKDSPAAALAKKAGAIWAPVAAVIGALGTLIGFWLLITKVFLRKRTG
jgi:hypothetical protein